MGLLADFIAATETEADAYDGGASIPESHKSSYKQFTELELGTLYHITQGKVVDDDTFYDFNVIKIVDDGEQLTTELLPDLTQRIAAASDAQLKSWSDQWAQTEELHCSGEELLPVLNDLRRLSKLAQAESKKVYLWNCV